MKVNGVNGRPLDKLKYTPLLNEGSLFVFYLRRREECQGEVSHLEKIAARERGRDKHADALAVVPAQDGVSTSAVVLDVNATFHLHGDTLSIHAMQETLGQSKRCDPSFECLNRLRLGGRTDSHEDRIHRVRSHDRESCLYRGALHVT